jgi:hypothetical protein
MSNKLLGRLLFAQGQRCFFCRQTLQANEASVEHLLAKSSGGAKSEDNCVACCKALNALFGSMSVKDKLQIVLNQSDGFHCPNAHAEVSRTCQQPALPLQSSAAHLPVVMDYLGKHHSCRPRTLGKLINAVRAQCRVEEGEAHAIVAQLRALDVIAVEGDTISYLLLDQTA